MKKVFAFLLAGLLAHAARAQTPAQEASNGFALFTKTKDFSQLEKAKKAIDRIYKTKKDSQSYRNNLLRSLIYSSLAVADVKRSLSYARDPSEEALRALQQLQRRTPKHGDDQHQQEIVFCRQKLALYFTEKANKDVKAADYISAVKAYQKVDSLSPGDWKIIHNLALLYEQLGNVTKSETFYKVLTDDRDRSSPEYVIGFARLYEKQNDLVKCMAVLSKGKERFPNNKEILFKIINLYANNRQYDAITALIDEAEPMDPKNPELYLLGASCYEKAENYSLAEVYYKKAATLKPDNYDANYSLGLLYLKLYLKENKDERLQSARVYLTRALAISPANVNALKSAELLFERTGDTAALENVRLKLKTRTN